MNRDISRPSLRRRLLTFLAVPMLALLLIQAALTYGIALWYSNLQYDNALLEDAQVAVKTLSDDSIQEKILREYEVDDTATVSLVSRRHGFLSGNPKIESKLPPSGEDSSDELLYDIVLDGQGWRAVTAVAPGFRESSDEIAVTLARPLTERRARAREILLITTPIQMLLILGTMSLVWFGVDHGLKVLGPLTQRLAERKSDLSPIADEHDVPHEIMPLIRTIDALFGRLRGMIALHERFVADAAHQLRTPLTGMGLWAEQALVSTDSDAVCDAIEHIRKLTRRAARTSSQLLALAQAQAPEAKWPQVALELTLLVPEWVALRIPEAIRAGLDLGYQAPSQALHVMGDAASLQEMLDNLIDNALRYAGQGSIVTVGLRRNGDAVDLYVEDNGRGVPPELLPRLGERFFRVPGRREEGTGLGLAIVGEIAERHAGAISYAHSRKGGLIASVRLPASTEPIHFSPKGW